MSESEETSFIQPGKSQETPFQCVRCGSTILGVRLSQVSASFIVTVYCKSCHQAMHVSFRGVAPEERYG